MTKDQKKELAEEMFVLHGYTMEKIAKKLSVSKSTVYNWMNEENGEELSWKEQKKLTRSSAHKIKQFIDSELVNAIETKQLNPKLADSMIKMVKVRESLDKQITPQTVIAVFDEFEDFIEEQDPEKRTEFEQYHRAFLYYKASKS